MIRPLLGVLIIFVIILVAEALWRTKLIRAEWSRKIVHMGVGSFVAFWPFFTSFRTVQLLSLAFCVIIVASRYLHIFKGIHNVQRKTWGELFYPVGMLLSALLTDNKYIFAAAILHLSLADGLAAIIGLKFGRKHCYKVETSTKSYDGTLSFALVSAVITAWTIHHLPGLNIAVWPAMLLLVPIITAVVENIMPYGSDNLFIPLTVIVLLRSALVWF